MKLKRTPVRVSKETHLKVIILLLILAAALICISRYVVSRPSLSSESSTRIHTPKNPAANSVSGKVSGTSAAAKTTENPVKKRLVSKFSGNSLELPFCTDAAFVLKNETGRYTLLYDTAYRQAAWVAYLLTRKEVRTKGAERKNAFRCDPEVVTRGWPTATDKDYSNSGYDRGHLLPSADRDDTPKENDATFYLSNISPQRPALNRQTWRNLEEAVRRWADRYDSVYVVTGGELKPGLFRIRGGVGVPERYFKALLVRHGNTYRSIAFLIPNFDKVQGRYTDYILTVNELEQEIGYDLFYNLPDSIEEDVESLVDRTFWN